MHAGAPGAGCSKALSSGPISSQPTSVPWVRGGAWEKSGARNGLASWAAITDGGITRRSWRAASSASTSSGSGSGSKPAWRCISCCSRRVASETSASSESRPKNAGWCAAIWARIVAMPSSRLS